MASASRYANRAVVSSSAGAELALRMPIEAAAAFAPLLREMVKNHADITRPAGAAPVTGAAR
jgi:hypothetical protein